VPEFFAASPKKSITRPTPNWPLDTPSGTPKERSVIAALLPQIASSCAHPPHGSPRRASAHVEQPAAPDVAGSEQLAHIPRGAGFILQLLLGEHVYAGREVTAEDDEAGPQLAQQAGHGVGREQPQEYAEQRRS